MQILLLRGLSASSTNVTLHALRFFFHKTLRREPATFQLPSAREPSKLAEIFGRGEVSRMLAAVATSSCLASNKLSSGHSCSFQCAPFQRQHDRAIKNVKTAVKHARIYPPWMANVLSASIRDHAQGPERKYLLLDQAENDRLDC